MLEKLKAGIIFNKLLGRPNIDKAYAMVGEDNSWYGTITTVHNALAKIKELPNEKWQITSHDGLSLKAIFYPGTTNKTVIWVHGYTSHAERESAFPGLFYHSMGFNVLVPYLRAHGPSEGKLISFGPMECLDMKKWVDMINIRNPKGSILFHGLSMGGGIVLDLATMDMDNVKCMIADAPDLGISHFFRDVTNNIFKKHQTKIIYYLCKRFQKEFSVDIADADRIFNAKKSKYPLFLSAGSEEHMEDRLSALKDNSPQSSMVLILPGCGHGNGMYKQTERYQSAIRAFVEKYMDS